MLQPNQNANSGLERATHICLIAVCLVSLALLVERRFSPHGSTPQPPTEKAFLGKHLEIAGADWRSAPLHAVLYLNTNCHFCRESTPFYREMAGRSHGHPRGVSLSVFSVESPEVMKQYLANEQIAVDGIYKLPVSVAGMTGTPTWFILDGQGIVRRVFIGKLDGAQEKELLKIVEAGAV